MSSTTKTNKLGLSQFLGTDVPDWRTDYNSDMGKIDKEFQDAEENILDTAEEIKANTYEKKYAGASGVQELFSEVSESFNVLSKRLDQVNIKRYYLNPGKSISIEFNMDAFVLCGYSMSKGGFFIARMMNGLSNAYIEEIGTVPQSISITANGNIHTITNNIGWNIQVFVIS